MPDPMAQALHASVLVSGGVILLTIWLLLAYWMFRYLSRKNQPPQPAFHVSELAILLQTIRGLVHEQKALAAEFNRSVDKRVTLIREVIQAFSEERERLVAAQAEMRQLLAQGAATAPVPEAAPEPEPDDLIDGWVGVDFDNAEQEPAEPEAPFEPESDADREQSQEAIHALLGTSEPKGPGTIHPFPDLQDDRERLGSVRARAYRFYDAGMTVAQIAQELGIGKGEVRLMLNLRERAE